MPKRSRAFLYADWSRVVRSGLVIGGYRRLHVRVFIACLRLIDGLIQNQPPTNSALALCDYHPRRPRLKYKWKRGDVQVSTFLMRQVLKLGLSETVSRDLSGPFSTIRNCAASALRVDRGQLLSSVVVVTKGVLAVTSLFPDYPARFWIF